MSIFNGKKIEAIYEENLQRVEEQLRKLKFCGCTPNFGGLHGWVFEQTVQCCLIKELKALRIAVPTIKEQVSLGGRAKADLVIGRVAIEIKAKGLFSSEDAEKYGRYMQAARKRELTYLYLTLGESYRPYRDGIIAALGSESAFFLDTEGDWERFVNAVAGELRRMDG